MSIILILVIYSIVGFLLNKIFFNGKLRFNIPLGFVGCLVIFEIISLPFLFVRGNFILLISLFLLILIPLLFFILFKYWREYLQGLVNSFKDKTYLVHLLIILIATPIVIMLTISEVDQMFYASQIISTIKTNQIYYNEGSATLMHTSGMIHQMEAYSAFNAMWIKVFNMNHVNYIFNIGRFLEMFIIIGIFGNINQLYFKNKKSSLILLACGLFGLNLLSATPFSVDEYVLLFAGTTGTFYMFVLLGPLLMLYFKVDRFETLFFILILIFTFAITYSFLPVMIFVALIFGCLNKNGKLFIITSILTLLYLSFYYTQFIWIFIGCAIFLSTFLFIPKVYKNEKLLYFGYFSVIAFCIIYGGFHHLLGLNGNLAFYLVIPLLFLYRRSSNYDEYIFKFISMFIIFNICFSTMFKGQEFAFMIVNTRSSVFLLIPYLIISIIIDYKLIRRSLAFIAVVYVILYAIIGVPNEYTRNVSEYIRDYQKYGSYYSTLIGNKDQEELIKYPFEVNSDLLFYDFTGPDRMDKFDDSVVQSLNKYIGVVNIYMNTTKDYCVQTTDCYVIISKFYLASNGYVRMIDLPPSDYILETEKYYLYKANDLDSINLITSEVEGLQK